MRVFVKFLNIFCMFLKENICFLKRRYIRDVNVYNVIINMIKNFKRGWVEFVIMI